MKVQPTVSEDERCLTSAVQNSYLKAACRQFCEVLSSQQGASFLSVALSEKESKAEKRRAAAFPSLLMW